MDYPDPDEEYELMHADEFELMNELEDEDFEFRSNVVSKNTPKRQLDFSKCTPAEPTEKLAADIPSVAKHDPSAIQTCEPKLSLSNNIVLNSDSSSEPHNSINNTTVISGYNDVILNGNKRTVSDLFGDISDLDFEISSQTKRQKMEEEMNDKKTREELLIRTIVEKRKQLNEEKSSFRLEKAQRVRKIGDSISYGDVPQWPFMPVSANRQRIYVRLHSEEEIQKDVKNYEFHSGWNNLLESPFKDVMQLAKEELKSKNEKLLSKKKTIEEVAIHSKKDLWVEKYKPKTYSELLSDEATNRSLLHWLKLWDKVVFNKEPKVMKRGFSEQDKRDLLDEQGRPVKKVALLCGPPGLGKTTLAHMIAKQAGYCPIEINASDDRSVQAFRTNLESATQMKSVMSSNPNPNCLILDEIDGAPQAAVDVLIKYVTHKADIKGKSKKSRGILKRPIICICNDIYVPALRSLRQIAYTIVFPSTCTSRLGERLVEISKMENLSTDLGTMMVLSNKSNNDIRSCLSILQYLKAKSSRITLGQVQASSVGSKDMQLGLFTVWEKIFQIKLNKKGQGVTTSNTNQSKKGILSGPSADVLHSVQNYGDYDRLTNGVFENFVKAHATDFSIGVTVKALDWFVFQDLLSSHIQASQNYSLYGYLPWAFVQWHTLFASIQKPKLSYPSTAYDVSIKTQKNRQILEFLFAGMSPKLQAYQQHDSLLLDVVPMLIVLITPNVRPISIQLYTQKEKDELHRVIGVMADYNVNYSQLRTPEGQYIFVLDPNLEELVSFGENPKENITTYTVRQLISKEVECEKIKRSAVKSTSTNVLPNGDNSAALPALSKDVEKPTAVSAVPNHLQKLTPKALKKKVVEVKAKDFFGRVVENPQQNLKLKAKTDEIVKSDIWFHFKEGYNNAVRKNVYMSDLL